MTHKNIIVWELGMVCQEGISNIVLLVIMPMSGTIIAISYRDSIATYGQENYTFAYWYTLVDVLLGDRNQYCYIFIFNSKKITRTKFLTLLHATVVIYFLCVEMLVLRFICHLKDTS